LAITVPGAGTHTIGAQNMINAMASDKSCLHFSVPLYLSELISAAPDLLGAFFGE
jgi:hypothetical protein